MLWAWLCYLAYGEGRNCFFFFFFLFGYIWERWSHFKSVAPCNPTCTWLKLPCPCVVCRLATGSSAEGRDWKLFCSVQVSVNAMVSTPKGAVQAHLTSVLLHNGHKQVPWWREEQGKWAWRCSQFSSQGLSTVTWLSVSHFPEICALKGLCVLMVLWFYCAPCMHRGLPMTQGFKTTCNLYERYCFPLPFSPAFVSPDPWRWVACEEEGSAPGLDTGWSPAS